MVGAMSTLWGGRRGAIRAELAGLVAKLEDTGDVAGGAVVVCSREQPPGLAPE